MKLAPIPEKSINKRIKTTPHKKYFEHVYICFLHTVYVFEKIEERMKYGAESVSLL